MMSKKQSDVHVITGIRSIINLDNIKPGVDLEELEKSMITNGLIQQTNKEPVNKFNTELQSMAEALGVDFSDGKSSSVNKDSPPDRDDSSSNDDVGGDDPADDEPEDDNQDDDTDSFQTPLFTKTSTSIFDQPKFQEDLNERTAEQRRREHIESIVSSKKDGNEYSLEKERKDDMKAAMLSDIDSLIHILTEIDIDLSRIPTVDRSSSYEEIESVLRMLRRKNDHSNYCTLADEILLFAAHGMEELFDGKRMWFDRYQPDLTGWHNSVNVKLHRMRYDTSQLVSTIMHDYNIGPGMRIALELIPNMILYSKMRKEQHDQPALYNDDEIARANDRLRQMG